MARSRSNAPLLAEFESVGFIPREIAAFLRSYGVDLEAAPVSPSPAVVPQNWPDWKMALSLLPRLTVPEAAGAFANIDPHYAETLRTEDSTEFFRWVEVLERNGFDDDTEGIDPARLAAWCDANGERYPLPRLPATAEPATDPKLRQALIESRRAAGEWKAKAHKLESEITELKHAAEQAAASEIDPRMRDNLLRIIAGLVEIGYPGSLRGTRIERFAEIQSDLIGKLGEDTPGERTLRDRLRDAAAMLPTRPPED